MRLRYVLLLWIAGLRPPCASGGEVSFLPVALTGQPAPGLTNNIRFSTFSYVSLADDGRLAFTANISGPNVTSTNNLGLWAGLPGDLRLVAQTGVPVPGDTNGTTFKRINSPNIDNHGAVGFLAEEEEEPNYAENMWLMLLGLGRSSNVKLNAAAQGLNVYLGLTDVFGHVVNVTGVRSELSGSSIGPTNRLAIVAGPPNNVVIVAQQGSSAPGVSGNFTFFPFPSQTLAFMPDGNVAFRATVSDLPATRDGIWFGKAGTLQAVMVGGKGAAPESLRGPGYTFGFGPTSENVEVNAKGELAFATPLAGPGLNNTNSDFVVAGMPGNFRVIAQMGQPAPGIAGAFFGPFAPFSHVFLGADGTVAFTGRYSDTGWDFGLWLAPTNGARPVLLMRNGQQAPGAPVGVVFTNSFQFLPPFEEAFMSARNQIVFRARVGGPGIGANNYGIWLAEPDGTVNLIARTGDMLNVGGGVLKQLSNVTFGVDPETIASPEDGRRSPFNDRGEIALLAYFTDFSSGLFLAQTGLNLSAEKSGTDLHLKFPTLAGKHYRVDYKTNLTDTAWSVFAASVDGTGGQVTVTNAGAAASNASGFYRVARTD
ncbi:MAG: hypothetical protein L0Z50_37560 [Verrucomicrobiales bacterium]|nr:hypothetical protein [Verrucomicrobiales bacterium]